MLIHRGPVAGDLAARKPIYFNDTPGFPSDLHRLGHRRGHPGAADPRQWGADPVPRRAPVAAFMLRRTALGRYTYALGTNEEALRLSGVNIDRWKIGVYAVAGGICAIAGILIASRINSAQPAIGQGYGARRHCRGRHRRNLAQRRPRHHARHADRRPHHQRRRQRPAHPLGRCRNGRPW